MCQQKSGKFLCTNVAQVVVVKTFLVFEALPIFSWGKSQYTVAAVGIFTSRTVVSDMHQWRCEPALSDHSVVFARWRQQHKKEQPDVGMHLVLMCSIL